MAVSSRIVMAGGTYVVMTHKRGCPVTALRNCGHDGVTVMTVMECPAYDGGDSPHPAPTYLCEAASGKDTAS